MEAGCPVAAYSAQHRVTVKFWNTQKKQLKIKIRVHSAENEIKNMIAIAR